MQEHFQKLVYDKKIMLFMKHMSWFGYDLAAGIFGKNEIFDTKNLLPRFSKKKGQKRNKLPMS